MERRASDSMNTPLEAMAIDMPVTCEQQSRLDDRVTFNLLLQAIASGVRDTASWVPHMYDNTLDSQERTTISVKMNVVPTTLPEVTLKEVPNIHSDVLSEREVMIACDASVAQSG